MLTVKQVRDAVQFSADSVGKRKDGKIVVRRGYFYRHGMDSAKFTSIISKLVPAAVVVDSGDKWTAFNGGASVANQSHFWVVLS